MHTLAFFVNIIILLFIFLLLLIFNSILYKRISAEGYTIRFCCGQYVPYIKKHTQIQSQPTCKWRSLLLKHSRVCSVSRFLLWHYLHSDAREWVAAQNGLQLYL